MSRPLPLCLGLLLGVAANAACAGIYGGFDAAGERNRIGFLGFQTGDRIVLDVFAADLTYRYIEGATTVSARRKMFVPSVGYRWDGDWNPTLFIGPSFVDVEEDRGTGGRSTARTGGSAKAGVYSRWSVHTIEALASYTTIDDFVWTRARVRRDIDERLSPGLEAFWMTGADSDSYGAGVVLGITTRPGTFMLKTGYQRSSNREHTVYGGIEAAVFF